MRKTGFMNVYRSGYFHREGKPDTMDRHSGDFYDTREAAIAAVEPVSHYIDTVEFSWEDPEDVQMNAHDSVPIPLFVSRKAFYAEQETTALITEAALSVV